MRAAVRCGYVAANRMLIGPPSETPMNAARSDPTASITALTSSIRCSSVGINGEPIRHARPRLVEHDEPGEGREATEHLGGIGVLPLVLDVRHEPWDPHDVQRPAADDLIGDVRVTALRVTRL